MAVHPVNDRFKVKVVTDEYGFGAEEKGIEEGIVVEVPDRLIYLSFHAFAFEKSLLNSNGEILKYYKNFVGKKIYWEAFQDRGRKIKEKDGVYIYLQMTDILAYADSRDDEAEVVNDSRLSGEGMRV